MNVSSRTPEGLPNRCPVCGNAIRLDPSRPPGDAPCPACGSLVWFEEPIGQEKERLRKTMAGIGHIVAGMILFILGVVFWVALIGSLFYFLGIKAKLMPNLGPMEVIVLLVLAVLLFGRKLPDIGRWMGNMMVRITKSWPEE